MLQQFGLISNQALEFNLTLVSNVNVLSLPPFHFQDRQKNNFNEYDCKNTFIEQEKRINFDQFTSYFDEITIEKKTFLLKLRT